MRRFSDITEPLAGFADRSGREARVHRYLQTLLACLFESWGYEEISVPIVERASSYSEEVVGSSPWPEWDKRGLIYLQLSTYAESYADLPEQEPAVLVPEGTISVSRWIAKNHALGTRTYPQKLFYLMPCFRNELLSKLSPTKSRQFHQAGVEILGTGHVRADLEVLLLAHRGLVEVGVPADSIVVRIGSVSLFNKICDETGLSEFDVLTVKDLLDTIAESRAGKQPERLEPSIHEVLEIVAKYALSSAVKSKWIAMTQTHVTKIGPAQVDCLGHPDELAALDYLAGVAREQGVSCVVDPSVVRSHEYYTGIVYELDIRLPGRDPVVEVAGGGRYNRLIGKFVGAPFGNDIVVPAVGFAFGLERLASIFFELASPPQVVHRSLMFYLGGPTTDVVVADAGNGRSALQYAAECRDRGERADVYVGEEYEATALAEYARQRDARLVTLGP